MATNKWSKNYPQCLNCGTVRFRHIARGYCTRCYRLVRRLEQVERWDLSNIRTLKGYPPETIYHTPDQFKKIKAGFLSQIRERLVFLKTKEEKLTGSIYGIDIEMQLRYIARKCGVRNRKLFFGVAGYIDDTFDPKRKRIFYELLNKIEENTPWRGIDWYKVFGN